MSDGYIRFFATREEALAHAVEITLKADAPLAFLAVYGPGDGSDAYAVVDAETALDLGVGDLDRVRVR